LFPPLLLIFDLFFLLLMIRKLLHIFVELVSGIIEVLLVEEFFLDKLVTSLFELLQLSLAFTLLLPGRTDEEVNSRLNCLPFFSQFLSLVFFSLEVWLVLELMPLVFFLEDCQVLLTHICLP